MNKKILLVLVFVLAGITNVMANTSKDEKVEVSSIDKKATTEYYLEIGSQSGSGVFSTIELINPFERKLRVVTRGRSTVEISFHEEGTIYGRRLFILQILMDRLLPMKLNRVNLLSVPVTMRVVVALLSNMKLGIIISEKNKLILC